MYYPGAAGIIHGVDIDTSHFTGNYAPKVSIQAANIYQGIMAPFLFVKFLFTIVDDDDDDDNGGGGGRGG